MGDPHASMQEDIFFFNWALSSFREESFYHLYGNWKSGLQHSVYRLLVNKLFLFLRPSACLFCFLVPLSAKFPGFKSENHPHHFPYLFSSSDHRLHFFCSFANSVIIFHLSSVFQIYWNLLSADKDLSFLCSLSLIYSILYFTVILVGV